MKKKVLWMLTGLALVLAFGLALGGCDLNGGSDNDPGGGDPGPGPGGTAPVTAVYLAGIYEDDDGNTIACYWKDGAKTDITTAGSYVTGIAALVK